MDYTKTNTNKREKAKIVDIVFDSQESEWEEVLIEDERVNFEDLSETPEPWYARVIALVFLALALVGGFLSLVFLIVAAPFALVGYLTNQSDWDTSVNRWGALFRRSMVVSLCSFVGIISVQFGLSIFMLYFTLYDPLPSLLGKAMESFGKE